MSADRVSIVRGANRTFFCDLLYPDSDTPIDLTSVESITVTFPSSDGTGVSVNDSDGGVAVLGAPGGGRIAVTLEPEHTHEMQLNPSQSTYQDLQVDVEDANGEVIIVILHGILSIVDPSYPLHV